jgi:post-segregation antitoxin (ccd killing protein)
VARKKKAGRTPSSEGRMAIKLTVPPYVAKRLKASGNASAAVKALMDAEIAKSSDNQSEKQ